MNHPLYDRKIASLAQLEQHSSFLTPHVQALRQRWESLTLSSSLPDAQTLVGLMHETRRVEMVYAAGQQDNATLWQDIREKAAPLWGEPLQEGQEPPFSAPGPGDNARLVKQFIRGVALQPGDHVNIPTGYFGKEVAHKLIEHCLKEGIDFEADIEDISFLQLLKHHSDKSQMQGLLGWYQADDAWRTKHIAIRADIAAPAKLFSAEEMQTHNTAWQEVAGAFLRQSSERRSNALHPRYLPWTLTYLPTRREAERDGMAYDDYKQWFMEGCDQPWDAIDVAQRKLVEAFNTGKEVRITNSDGTDVAFSIDGHSFANSGAVRNIPGSEFFSAPVKTSVNGTIVATGNYHIAGKDISDMRLTIKNGRIESWDAAKGKEVLDEIITRGDKAPALDPATGAANPEFEGTRYFGEIGFGTNPHLQRATVNGLLVEKISGSFHMAIGDAYRNGYMGDASVTLDNGNRAPKGFHWDITTMLKGKDGEIYLDGHLMQKDGRWQAVPELGISASDIAVLNDGWRALQKAGKPIPDYWKQKYAAQDRSAGQSRH